MSDLQSVLVLAIFAVGVFNSFIAGRGYEFEKHNKVCSCDECKKFREYLRDEGRDPDGDGRP